MSEVIIDNGPWHTGVTSDGRHYLESDDFTHDVRLYIDGDFSDDNDKARYAKGIAGQINGKLMPGAVSAEPVAWMLTGAHGHTRCVWVEAPSAEMLEMAKIDGDTVTPLYSRPVADQAQPESWEPAGPLSIECDPVRFGALPWHITDGQNHAIGETPNDALNRFARHLAAQPQQPVSGADQFRDAAQMIEPSGNSGELPANVEDALDLMDALLAPDRGLLAVPYTSATVTAAREDLALIRSALAQQDADPLQGAADWLVKHCAVSDSVELASRLSIGYNRASRLLDTARKGGDMTLRESFEVWWSENMNTLEMDLHRNEYPMTRPSEQPYACHDTQRGWWAFQAGFDAARKEAGR